jgi:hypothetical protein
MTWNMLHYARMLKDAGGVPTYGNSTADWDLCHPEHRAPDTADEITHPCAAAAARRAAGRSTSAQRGERFGVPSGSTTSHTPPYSVTFWHRIWPARVSGA